MGNIDFNKDVEGLLKKIPRKEDRRRAKKFIEETFKNKDVGETIDEMITFERTTEQKRDYYENIKPRISGFLDFLKEKQYFRSLSELASQKVKEGKEKDDLKKIFNQDELSFINRMEILKNRYFSLLNLFQILRKENKGLRIDEKMYVLANLYRSVVEVIPKIFYEVNLNIVVNLFKGKAQKDLLKKINKDKVTIGEQINLIKRFEKKFDFKNKEISRILKKYIDVGLRNSIAHESYSINSNKIVCSGQEKIFTDKQLLDEIMKVNFVFRIFYFPIYQRPSLEMMRRYPEKWDLKF